MTGTKPMVLHFSNPVSIHQVTREGLGGRTMMEVSIQIDHADLFIGEKCYSLDTFGIREWKKGRGKFVRRIKRSKDGK